MRRPNCLASDAVLTPRLRRDVGELVSFPLLLRWHRHGRHLGSARRLLIEKFSKPDSLFTQGRQCKQIRRLSLSAKQKVFGAPEPSSAGPGPLEHGLPELKCFAGAAARQNDGLAAATAAGDKLCT